ncbi:hypothetical protein ACUSIJ_08410 [Pseudochelatococcus sp. B33]
MTASDSAKAVLSLTDSLTAKSSIRALLGLDVEHLLPGLDIAADRFRQGDEQGALRIYATLVLCDPTEPRFQIGLAACALDMGLAAVALRAASAVIACRPESPEGYHLSGHASAGLEEYDDAVRDFTEALRLARKRRGCAEIARDSERMLARLAALPERTTRPGTAGDDPAARARPQRPIAASA